jgi:hypothetical protein
MVPIAIKLQGFIHPKMLRKVIRRRRSRSGLSAILWMHLQLCFGPQ